MITQEELKKRVEEEIEEARRKKEEEDEGTKFDNKKWQEYLRKRFNTDTYRSELTITKIEKEE